jgi:hypothetical protein
MRIITKTILTIVTILFANACATTPTMKSVAGIYENSVPGAGIWKILLIKNGDWVSNQEGKSDVGKGHWEIVNEELRLTYNKPKEWYGHISVYRINENGSITHIAFLKEGKREEIPKDKQPTSKKLN